MTGCWRQQAGQKRIVRAATHTPPLALPETCTMSDRAGWVSSHGATHARLAGALCSKLGMFPRGFWLLPYTCNCSC